MFLVFKTARFVVNVKKELILGTVLVSKDKGFGYKTRVGLSDV